MSDGATRSLDDAVLRAQLGRTLDATPFRTIRGQAIERSEMGGGDPDGFAGGAGGKAPRGIERSEMGGGDPDGSAGGAGGKAPRGIERSEMGGGDPDGSAGGAGGKAPRGIERYDGKVRDCFIDRARGERIIIVTDRLSAFDAVVGTIPFKGQVLNQLAQFWFEHTRSIAPNHMLAVPDPNVMIARECEPLPVELVMRAYLTGVTSTSIWKAYEAGARTFCGHALPDGMRKNQPLPRPILTPSTKAAKGDHDVSVSRDELLAMGRIAPELFDRAAELAAALFAAGQRHAASRGLILADTKYEIGIDRRRPGAGNPLVIIDEIHTPDSSRYWYADDYEARLARGEEPRSLDKEYVRRWLAGDARWSGDGPPPVMPDEIRVEAARRYIASYELVTGRGFVPDTSDPIPRIAAALAAA